jgi:hypothetical protein
MVIASMLMLGLRCGEAGVLQFETADLAIEDQLARLV